MVLSIGGESPKLIWPRESFVLWLTMACLRPVSIGRRRDNKPIGHQIGVCPSFGVQVADGTPPPRPPASVTWLIFKLIVISSVITESFGDQSVRTDVFGIVW